MDSVSEFGQVRDVAITILVDNRADLIVESTETVKYFGDKPLLAEHGFAALIDLKATGTRILWDAGMTVGTLPENARCMGIDLGTIAAIALSHGHDDHTTAVTDVLREMELRPKAKEWKPGVSAQEIRDWVRGRRLPIIAHPAAFHERWAIDKDGTRYGPIMPPPREQWEALGAEVVLAEGPHRLSPGCWTTGFVPRLSFESAGRSSEVFYRQGDAFLQDDISDDQAIVLHIAGKGLVVLSGCAHAGIVNTIHHAREISGVDRVWAVIGGFHLAGATDEEIARTIAEMQQLGPALVAPTHCTGLKAIAQFSMQMPAQFTSTVVGTTFSF